MKLDFRVEFEIPNTVLNTHEVIAYRPPLFNEQFWSFELKGIFTCASQNAAVPSPILRKKLEWPKYLHFDAICIDIVDSHSNVICVRGFVLNATKISYSNFEVVNGIWRSRPGCIYQIYSLSTRNLKDETVMLVDIPGVENINSPTILLNPKHVRKNQD